MDTANTLRFRGARPLGESARTSRRDGGLSRMATFKYQDSSSIGRVSARSERYGEVPAEADEPRAAHGAAPVADRATRTRRRSGSASNARRGGTPNRALVVLGVIVAVVAVCAFALYGPLRDYYVARRSHDALTAQLTQLTVANDQIQDHVDALQTREGIEDEARRRGYVEDGAQAVNVTGLPEGVDAQATGSDVAFMKKREAEAPWYQEFLDFIFQYTPPED